MSRSQQDQTVQDASLMEPLLRKYSELTAQIPKPLAPTLAHASQKKQSTVILTGSTGTVGTFLLRSLLDSPEIEHVICLNRREDGGRAAQEQRFAAAELETRDLDQHATFLRADLSKHLLGLSNETYDNLRARASVIIHNAWPVNFNLGLSAFESHLAGLVNLLRLAVESTPSHKTRIVFISSVSAIGGLASRHEAQAEQIFTSFDTPAVNGYARSKFLSELLCNKAAEYLGIPVDLVRLGQVAGAARRPGSHWNRDEWLPSLVVSSRDLGCLPSDLGSSFSVVDWTPSDLLADVLLELVISPTSSTPELGLESNSRAAGVQVFNVRNPRTTSWESLLPAVIEAFKAGPDGSNTPITVVSPSTWLARLRDDERKASDHRSTTSPSPAVKLLEFYSNNLWDSSNAGDSQLLKPMEIDGSLAKSETLRQMPAVNGKWMQKWVSEWFAVNEPSTQ